MDTRRHNNGRGPQRPPPNTPRRPAARRPPPSSEHRQAPMQSPMPPPPPPPRPRPSFQQSHQPDMIPVADVMRGMITVGRQIERAERQQMLQQYSYNSYGHHYNRGLRYDHAPSYGRYDDHYSPSARRRSHSPDNRDHRRDRPRTPPRTIPNDGMRASETGFETRNPQVMNAKPCLWCKRDNDLKDNAHNHNLWTCRGYGAANNPTRFNFVMDARRALRRERQAEEQRRRGAGNGGRKTTEEPQKSPETQAGSKEAEKAQGPDTDEQTKVKLALEKLAPTMPEASPLEVAQALQRLWQQEGVEIEAMKVLKQLVADLEKQQS